MTTPAPAVPVEVEEEICQLAYWAEQYGIVKGDGDKFEREIAAKFTRSERELRLQVVAALAQRERETIERCIERIKHPIYGTRWRIGCDADGGCLEKNLRALLPEETTSNG